MSGHEDLNILLSKNLYKQIFQSICMQKYCYQKRFLSKSIVIKNIVIKKIFELMPHIVLYTFLLCLV